MSNYKLDQIVQKAITNAKNIVIDMSTNEFFKYKKQIQK